MFRRHKDFFITLFLVLFSAVLAMSNIKNIGLAWDEAIYFGWVIRYAQWFDLLFKLGLGEALTEAAINHFWVGANQHPPLVILLGACSFSLLADIIGPVTSLRLVNIMFFALSAGLVFRLGLISCNRRAGLLAALILIGLPRIFGHSLIYGMDMPMAFMWLLTVFCFIKGLENKYWSLLTGFCLGLALLTKINAVLLPIVFLLWPLFVIVLRYFCRERNRPGQVTSGVGAGRLIDILKQAKWNFLSIFFVSPLVMFCLWPRLWYHPVALIKAYFLNKIDRMVIPVYYLGQQYTQDYAPWHYPLVLILFTVPVVTWILFAAGVFSYARNIGGDIEGNKAEVKTSQSKAELEKNGIILTGISKNEIGLLIILCFDLQLLLAVLPGVPRYDGVRLFLNIFPFMALVAGWGADWLWNRFLTKKTAMTIVSVSFVVLFMVPLYRAKPFYLSYYNELAGGIKGAKKIGLETTYWGETCNDDILNWLNKNLAPGAKICIYPLGSQVAGIWKILGRVRPDIEIDSDYKAGDYDYLVLNCRQGFFDEQLWNIYKNKKPLFDLQQGGVSVTKIYKF